MSGSSLTVYVAYHDSRPHPGPEDRPYVAVCNVRPDGSRPEGFSAYDDDGGFPERNTAYCELSVLRRLETRAQTPYVGLCHYRRLLAARRPQAPRGEHPGSFRVAGWDWADPDAHAAGAADLLAAVADRDWCTPAPYDVRRAGFASLWEQYAANHPTDVLDAADRSIADRYPELPSFTDHLLQTSATPLFNVFLGRREVLLRYTSFLWPVLDACAASSPFASADRYQVRWAGFLAERLHGYWLQHVAAPAGLRVGALPLLTLERPPAEAGAAPHRSPALRGGGALRETVSARLPPAVLLRAHRARRRLSTGPRAPRSGQPGQR